MRWEQSGVALAVLWSRGAIDIISLGCQECIQVLVDLCARTHELKGA